jgi:hypothetical protein
MIVGFSFIDAKKRINDENRAICVICGKEIPGRSRETTLFCTRTQKCRTAKRSYLWKIEKGMPRDIALEAVISQLVTEQLRETA